LLILVALFVLIPAGAASGPGEAVAGELARSDSSPDAGPGAAAGKSSGRAYRSQAGTNEATIGRVGV
jgi:hypothetical protein